MRPPWEMCGLALMFVGVVGCASDPPPRAPVGHLVPRCGEGPLPPTCTIATGHFPRYLVRPTATEALGVPRGDGDLLAQPSEMATAARRTFDSQRWPEAIVALDAVARGDGSDDRGNREIAEYDLAISLFNLRELQPAEDLFFAITRDTAHQKHREAVMWSVRFLTTCPSARTADALLALTPESVPRFESPQQVELAHRVDLLLARRLLERGDRVRSRALVDALRRTSLAQEAERCFAATPAR